MSPDNEAARERAQMVVGQIPDYIWDGRSLPVPVEEIASSWFNLHVCDKSPEELAAAPGLPGEEREIWLAGLLLTHRKEIWVNADEARQWPSRRRFTICHELGHWSLHRSGQQSLFCRASHVDSVEGQLALDVDAHLLPPSKPPAPPFEIEADTFAANLLMPADLFRHHFLHTTTNIPALQALFGASEKAVLKRIRALNLA